jgi:hypothetical protein
VLSKLTSTVLVVATLVVAVACGPSKPLLNPKDPFDDPFFHDGMGSGTNSLDEIMHEPAPSVGWLSHDGARPPHDRSDDDPGGGSGLDGDPGSAGAESKLDANGEGVLLQAEGDGSYVGKPRTHHHQAAAEDDGEALEGTGGDQKSFSEKAEEASLATMSILMGLGMAALPFLIGT